MSSSPWQTRDILSLLARCLLAALFLYMGLSKALHPVEFLKLLRQYDILHQYLWLNVVASTLPWFEVFCGLCLLSGIAVRGTSLVLLAMLMFFSALVFLRALAVHNLDGLPLCTITFDCGCGAGKVLICRKLLENL